MVCKRSLEVQKTENTEWSTWKPSIKQPVRRCSAQRMFSKRSSLSAFFSWIIWWDCLGTDGIMASSTVGSAVACCFSWSPNMKLIGWRWLIKLDSLIWTLKICHSTQISQYLGNSKQALLKPVSLGFASRIWRNCINNCLKKMRFATSYIIMKAKLIGTNTTLVKCY